MTASRARSVGLGFLIIVVNVLIVTSVAIGFSQRGFSGWWATLRGEWVPIEDALDVEDPLAEDDPVSTSAPDDDAVTTAPPAPTEEVTEDAEPPTAAELYAQGEDLTVLVLGDRTGVHENDWPAAWGRMMSSERAVGIFSPQLSDPTQYGDPLLLGQGEAAVSLYNASFVDGTPEYAAERLALLGAQTPDVVLVNYGRTNTPDDLPGQLDELWTGIGEEFPDAEAYVVVAPPRLDGLSPTVQATRTWADETDAPLIDVAAEFEERDIVADTLSTRDPLAVNIPGNELWAQIVHETVLDAPAPEAPAAEGDAAGEAGPGAGESEGEVGDPQAEAPPSADDPQPPSQQPAPAPGTPTYQPPALPPYQPPAPPPYQPPAPPVQPTPTPTPAPPPAPAPTPPPVDPPPTDPEPTDPEPTDPGATEPVEPEEPQPIIPPTGDPSDPVLLADRLLV